MPARARRARDDVKGWMERVGWDLKKKMTHRVEYCGAGDCEAAGGAAVGVVRLAERGVEMKHDSFSITQECRDDAGIAAAVKYGQNEEWFFIRRIGDQKIPYGMEAQWPGGQIGAAVAHVRKRNEGANSVVDFLDNAACCIGIVGSDVFPNFGQV